MGGTQSTEANTGGQVVQGNVLLAKTIDARFRSFASWPLLPSQFPCAHPWALATQGFQYLPNQQVQDGVICSHCRVIVGQWEPTDVPARVHASMSPECPFVKGQVPSEGVPARLKTFDKWPLDPTKFPNLTPHALAAQGFQFTPHARGSSGSSFADGCTCEYCHVLLGAWSTDDDCAKAHAEMRPACPKVLGHVHDSATIPDEKPVLPLTSVGGRLRTFALWPLGPPDCPNASADALAAHGFHYNPSTKFRDRVSCIYCGLHLHSWDATDVPAEAHSKMSPQCPFVLGHVAEKDEDGALCDFNASVAQAAAVAGGDGRTDGAHDNGAVAPVQGTETTTVSGAPSTAHITGSTSKALDGNKLDDVVTSTSLKTPTVDARAERLASFIDWPLTAAFFPNATGDKLAAAGFAFAPSDDYRDQVRCVYCNLHVANWAPSDEPATEHAKASPSCPFVLGSVDGDTIEPKPSLAEPVAEASRQPDAPSSTAAN